MRATRESLAAVLDRGREVEVEGQVLRLVVPAARRVSELRGLAQRFSQEHGGGEEEGEDRDRPPPTPAAIADWTEIVVEAVAATLLLDGDDAPMEDTAMADRLVTWGGGITGSLAVAAMEQCGMAPKRTDDTGDAAAEGGGPFPD